jgi:tRNA (Thr-GGU) A37 N-methylase
MEAIDATPVVDIKAVLAQSEDRCKTKRVLQSNISRRVAGLAATALLRVRHLLRE